jgi:hypothetical protein
VGRETFAFAPDYDGPGELPGDARRLTVAAEEAAIASCPGRELEPNPCRCPCYGCKHHCSAHDPADVVELTVTAGDVRRIAEVLLDVLPQVYGYRLGDEPANLDGALGRDAEKVAARLRSAGDGAADVLGKSAEWGLVNDRGDLTLVPAPDRVTLRHLADSYVVRSVTRGEWVVPLDSRSPKPDPWSPEPEVRARPNRCYHGVAIGNSCPLCRFESRCEADR